MIWTKEILQDEANKYETRSDFRKKNKNAYRASIKRKIIDEIFKNHTNQGRTNTQVPMGYWNKETLQEESDKYLTRKQFETNCSGAYATALRKKIMDELFKNHPNQGYSDKEEWKENSYVIYVYELEFFNKAYVGLTNNIIRRDREHLFNKKEKMILFCKENNLSLPKYKIVEDNLNNKNVKDREKYWYNFYKDNGWDMFNVAKTGSLGSLSIKWTKKALRKEANKYNTRSEFQKENGSAYMSALHKKIMDDLFKNHPNNGYSNKQVKQGYWTIEKLQEEANKYLTRNEFNKKCSTAYQTASNKKIMDDLFKNHPNQGYDKNKKPNGYWTKETLQKEANKYLTRNDFIKNNSTAYIAASKLRIMNDLFKNHLNKGYKKL